MREIFREAKDDAPTINLTLKLRLSLRDGNKNFCKTYLSSECSSTKLFVFIPPDVLLHRKFTFGQKTISEKRNDTLSVYLRDKDTSSRRKISIVLLDRDLHKRQTNQRTMQVIYQRENSRDFDTRKKTYIPFSSRARLLLIVVPEAKLRE